MIGTSTSHQAIRPASFGLVHEGHQDFCTNTNQTLVLLGVHDDSIQRAEFEEIFFKQPLDFLMIGALVPNSNRIRMLVLVP